MGKVYGCWWAWRIATWQLVMVMNDCNLTGSWWWSWRIATWRQLVIVMNDCNLRGSWWWSWRIATWWTVGDGREWLLPGVRLVMVMKDCNLTDSWWWSWRIATWRTVGGETASPLELNRLIVPYWLWPRWNPSGLFRSMRVHNARQSGVV